MLVEEARQNRLVARLLGGVGVRLRCEVGLAGAPELARLPNDIDLVGPRRQRAQFEAFLCDQKLVPEREFNLVVGDHRLLYSLKAQEHESIRVDVVLDRLEMCHVLELAERMDKHPLTISATDLLLSKLQIVFPSERDIKDTLALLATFDIQPTPSEPDHLELDYLCHLCGSDWGWYRTVTINLERVEGWVEMVRQNGIRSAILSRARALHAALADCPKTLRWRLRSLVGERQRWYQIPEELGLA